MYGNSFLNYFLTLIFILRKNNIHPIFIFDGKALIEKSEEKTRRRNDREKAINRLKKLKELIDVFEINKQVNDEYLKKVILNILNKKNISKIKTKILSPERVITVSELRIDLERRKKQLICPTDKDINDLKYMFKLLKIQYVVAPNDAEAYCSLLCNTRKVSGVLSNDTDCYVFGIRNNDYILATNLNIKKETIIIIRPKEILESLNLKMLEFIDFCICCGCDYNRNIKGIGPEKSFKLIKKYKSIDQINCVDTEILNVVRCREIFNLTTNISEVCIRVRYCNNVVKWGKY